MLLLNGASAGGSSALLFDVHPWLPTTALFSVRSIPLPPISRRGEPVPGCYNTRMTLMEITFALQARLTPEQLRALGTYANTYGLHRFHVDEKANSLSFEYDGSRLKETEVTHVLRQARIPVLGRIETDAAVSQV
jgi:hypothetical protein